MTKRLNHLVTTGRASLPTCGKAPESRKDPAGVGMTFHGHKPKTAEARPLLSLAIFARNEEGRIGAALDSLFRQSILEPAKSCHGRIEFWILANGCNDGTAAEARTRLDGFHANPRFGCHWNACVCEWPAAGKIGAWNRFTHELSHPGAKYLGYMDADIEIGHRNTVWNLCRVLQEHPEAEASVDKALQDFRSRFPKPILKRVLSGTARLSRMEPVQICGQLYVLRSPTGRQIRFPRDLPACEDAFIDSYLRGDFGNTQRAGARVVLAADAHHFYRPYTRIADILRNQKRQIVGQTVLHVLRETLRGRTGPTKTLADELAQREKDDPDWLKKRIQEHLSRSKKLGELFPKILLFRIHRWQRLPALERVIYFPATLFGWLGTLLAAWSARRHLAMGKIQYWPDSKTPSKTPRPNSGVAAFGFWRTRTPQNRCIEANGSEAC
jgi:hypothetical protein